MKISNQNLSRDLEVKRLASVLSFQTLNKIQIRIQQIRMYYGNFQKIKKKLGANEHELVYRVYFIAIAVLYRSLFKKLDKENVIDVEKLGIKDDEDIYDNHCSIINIVDKDLAHLDKNSKTHKILDVKMFEKNKSTTMTMSFISEDKLAKSLHFLNMVLEPVIQEATAVALEK